MSWFKKEELLDRSTLLFSNKALISVIVPLVLQQVFAVLVGTIDTMMVAYTGEAAVSGVSLVNTLDTLLVIFFTAMVTGGSVVISQALGKKESQETHESAKQLLYISTAIAIVLAAVVVLLRRPLLYLLFGSVEVDVMHHAMGYFFFVALSFPALAIIESAGACFRSAGNTVISLAVSLVANLLNVCGNAIFIMVFDMGGAGAGLSTLIARVVAAIISLVLVHQKKRVVHVEQLLRYKPNPNVIRRILHIGVPNGLENTMFQFGRLLTQALIATMGTSVIAANSVALSISNFQYMTGTACSAAMITVVGRCIGAEEKRQATYYARKILAINYGLIWTVILGILLFLRPLIGLYDLSPESARLAQDLILFHCIVAGLIWPIGFMLPSSFRAAGDVRFTMVVSVASMWLFRVATAYPLALDSVSVFGLFTIPGFGMGIMGVWTAMFIDWVFRCSLFFIRHASGRWLRAKQSV